MQIKNMIRYCYTSIGAITDKGKTKQNETPLVTILVLVRV